MWAIFAAPAAVALLFYYGYRTITGRACSAADVMHIKVGPWIYLPPAALRPVLLATLAGTASDPAGTASVSEAGRAPCDVGRAPPRDATGFSFRLPPSDRLEGTSVAPSVRLTSSIAPAARPTALAPDPDAIRSIAFGDASVSGDGHWATFVMTWSTHSGVTESTDVRCQWASSTPSGTSGRPFNCRSVLLLDNGNTFELVASPRNGEMSLVGAGLLAALKALDSMEKRRVAQ